MWYCLRSFIVNSKRRTRLFWKQSNIQNILILKQLGCFTLTVFLMYGDSQCSVALPHGAVGWSSVFVVKELGF